MHIFMLSVDGTLVRAKYRSPIHFMVLTGRTRGVCCFVDRATIQKDWRRFYRFTGHTCRGLILGENGMIFGPRWLLVSWHRLRYRWGFPNTPPALLMLTKHVPEEYQNEQNPKNYAHCNASFGARAERRPVAGGAAPGSTAARSTAARRATAGRARICALIYPLRLQIIQRITGEGLAALNGRLTMGLVKGRE